MPPRPPRSDQLQVRHRQRGHTHGDSRPCGPNSPCAQRPPGRETQRQRTHQGNPASGAIASSQGTRPGCRLPLAALHPLTRDDLPWRPAAVLGTVPAGSRGPSAPGDVPWKEQVSPAFSQLFLFAWASRQKRPSHRAPFTARKVGETEHPRCRGHPSAEQQTIAPRGVPVHGLHTSQPFS